MENERPPLFFSGEGPTAPRLFTIGHSNHELGVFLRLLHAAGATAVADVRSAPYSPRYPHYNREELERALSARGLVYVFLGDLLGGRPQRPSLYDPDGRVNYERVRQAAEFREGLDRLVSGLDQHTPALLCAEEDPLDCHRGLMITPALGELGLAPVHLRGDGSAETTAAMEQRLLSETGVGAGVLDGLFAAAVTDDERRRLLAEAYRLRARRKAFRWRPEASDEEAAG